MRSIDIEAKVAATQLRSPGGTEPIRVSDNFGGRVDRIIAVSYTHLRAHETVLDLVCRLLLEKKNTIR